MLRLGLIVMLFLPSFMCLAGEKVEKEIALNNSKKVVLDFARGEVTVFGHDKEVILLSGELDESATGLNITQKSDKIIVELAMKGRVFSGDMSKINVYLPRSVFVALSGVETNYHVFNVDGGLYVKTMSGNINLTQVMGKMSLSSVSGELNLANVTGKAKLETVSGNMNIAGHLQHAFVKSVSGDLIVNLPKINQFKVKNISGSTLLVGELNSSADVSISSVNGNIEYIAQGKLDAQCDLVSQFGGNIINSVTDDKVVSGKVKKSLNFVSGDGTSRITLKTLSGEINIKKAKGPKDDA